MPELPEVETIRRSLAPLVEGRRVASVEVRRRDLRRPIPQGLESRLRARRISQLERRGKYLIVRMDRGAPLTIHLGMSGRFLHQAVPGVVAVQAHDHLVINLDDKSRLVLNDPRRFGMVFLDETEDIAELARLGPEPFDESDFSAAYLFALRKKTKRTVKDVLMDQRVVAGLGNIYVNELLYTARVRPTRRLNTLTRAECKRVVSSTRAVLGEAIEHRGSTISDFLDGIGRRGGYQWRRRVYDRKDESCASCNSAIKAIVIGQRSTFYCPSCQT